MSTVMGPAVGGSTVGMTSLVVGDAPVGQRAAKTLSWLGVGIVLTCRHRDRMERFPDRHGLATVGATRTDLASSSASTTPKLAI